MPEISTYMGHVDIDIDIDDFLDQCDEDEIGEIIEYLKNKYSTVIKMSYNQDSNLIHETQKTLFELGEHAHKFTPEEESFLETMYKRYL